MFGKLTVFIIAAGVFAFLVLSSCSTPVNISLTIENGNATNVFNVYWNGVYYGDIPAGNALNSSVSAGTGTITYYFVTNSNQMITTSPVTVYAGDNDSISIQTNL